MLDHRQAALRRLLAAERSVVDGAGDTGSEREKGHAHRARKNVGKLNVLMGRQGALGRVGNLSSELLRRRCSRVVVVGVARDRAKAKERRG